VSFPMHRPIRFLFTCRLDPLSMHRPTPDQAPTKSSSSLPVAVNLPAPGSVNSSGARAVRAAGTEPMPVLIDSDVFGGKPQLARLINRLK